ncbi:MAG: flagellar motor switch protein FliN [Candidatus Gastranaerophilales bacterium]|nr:flagellar motor switch protein FliN [Candidatus Gastranaerophilales bacterium]
MDRDLENFDNLENFEGENKNNPLQIEDEFAFLDEENANEAVQSEEIEEIEEIEHFEQIEQPILQQEATIQTPIIEDFENTKENNDLITVRPVKFQEFQPSEPNRAIKKNLDILQDIQMHVSVELGKSKLSIKDVMEMEKGSIVELDKIAGEQVEIYVNKKLVARGEVIVIEDKFGVRVVSTNLPKPTI